MSVSLRNEFQIQIQLFIYEGNLPIEHLNIHT